MRVSIGLRRIPQLKLFKKDFVETLFKVNMIQLLIPDIYDFRKS